jgi:hypothetical protein
LAPLHSDLFGVGQQRVQQKWRRRGQLACAQILLGDSGQQGLLLMKLPQHAHQALAHRLKPAAIDDPGLRLFE